VRARVSVFAVANNFFSSMALFDAHSNIISVSARFVLEFVLCDVKVSSAKPITRTCN
jgi:hypothetical protein